MRRTGRRRPHPARAYAGLLAAASALLAGCAATTPTTPAAAPAAPLAVRADDRPTRPTVTQPPTPAALVALPVSAVRPAGTGQLEVVPGSGAPVGAGPLRRYLVEVEGGVGVAPAAFAAAAERTLADPRSWTAGGRRSLQRVDAEPVDVRLVLASPALTDQLCAPLRTGGRFSCHQDGRAVINAMRWLSGADAYADRLADYRHYVVNHEVGHALRHGHVGCPGAGEPAPVMMQQTKGVGRCVAQPWPFPRG